MLVIAVTGLKKAGKTTLSSMLISALKGMGYRVAAAKHVHHADFTIDREGKDSWRFYVAGADPVIISSPGETTVIHRSLGVRVVEDLKRLASDVDVMVIEGFRYMLSHEKDDSIVKIKVLSREGEDVEHDEIPVSFSSELGARYTLPKDFASLLQEVLRFIARGEEGRRVKEDKG